MGVMPDDSFEVLLFQSRVLSPPLSRSYDEWLGATGTTFAVALPAGRYRVMGWGAEPDMGWLQGSRAYASQKEFAVPFEIFPGGATYLGNLHFSQHWVVSLRDRSARDLPAIKARFAVVESRLVSFPLLPDTNLEGIGGEYGRRWW